MRKALLILSKPLSILKTNASEILSSLPKPHGKKLYICIAPDLPTKLLVNKGNVASKLTPVQNPPTTEFKDFLVDFYAASAAHPEWDVCVLLDNIGEKTDADSYVPTTRDYDTLLYTDGTMNKTQLLTYVERFLPANRPITCCLIKTKETKTKPKKSRSLLLSCVAKDTTLDTAANGHDPTLTLTQYDHVVLGGTFDRLHTGHKILLSRACLLANKSITVGVTDGDMNKKKTLVELMEETSTRISVVRDFITSIRPSLEQKVVPINDPFGPAIVDDRLQCIVVSEETLKGGEMVNERRAEKGLCTLDIDVIDLICDEGRATEEEEKISSSSQRMRLLGTLLAQPLRPPSPTEPYIIGLTGGIASGKTSICKRLKKLGAATIDCDLLGHQAYAPGSETLDTLVETFGPEILTDNGEINRKALGAIVFKDREQREKLNEIVWPVIAKLCCRAIEEERRKGAQVIVLEAAVLLEAKWTFLVHEVWSVIVPPAEAVKRIMDRNQFTEQESLERVQSQMTNSERLQQSHVVLCTLWEPEVTQKYVEKSWKLLLQRLREGSSSQLKSAM